MTPLEGNNVRQLRDRGRSKDGNILEEGGVIPVQIAEGDGLTHAFASTDSTVDGEVVSVDTILRLQILGGGKKKNPDGFGNGGKSVDAGSEGAEGENVQGIRKITRKAVRIVFLAVGGTGKETLQKLEKIIESYGGSFGNGFDAPSGEHLVIDAMYVDTNVVDADAVENTDSAKRNAEVDQEMTKKGVSVVRLSTSGKGRQKWIMQKGLRDEQALPKISDRTDTSGAQADPRIGQVEYLVAREDGGNNPVDTLKEIVSKWTKGKDNPRVKSAKLFVVGGSHGGTGGGMSLEIGEEASVEMEKALDGLGIHPEKHRYVLTSETSDEASRNDLRDALGKKRRLNEARYFLKMLYAWHKKAVELYPKGPKLKSDNPIGDFVWVFNGENHRMKSHETHYGPTEVMAEHIAGELLGIASQLKSGRSNMRPVLLDKGTDAPFNPDMRVLSYVNVSTIKPREGERTLTIKKRIELFAKALGLNGPEVQEVMQMFTSMFPEAEKFMNDKLGEKDQAGQYVKYGDVKIRLLSDNEFGQDEEVIRAVPAKTKAFIQDLKDSGPLLNLIEENIKASYDDLNVKMAEKLAAIKSTYGLDSAILFVQQCIDALGKLDAKMDEKLKDCSVTILAREKQNIGLAATAIGQKTVPFIGKKGVLSLLNSMAADLLKDCNKYAIHFRDNLYCSNAKDKLIAPLLDLLEDEKRALVSQKADAESVLRKVDDIPVPISNFPKATDLFLDAQLYFDDDSRELRGEFLGEEEEWTTEKMMELMKAIKLTPNDTNLMEALQNPDTIETLEDFSTPMIIPASKESEEIIKSDTAKRVRVAMLPVDNEAAQADPSLKEPFPVPKGFTEQFVGQDGAYGLWQELHQISPLDDKHMRECLRELLMLPATIREAEAVKAMHPGDPEFSDELNKEMMFTWKKDAEEMLKGLALALAQRDFAEQGANRYGAIVEECAGENCGLAYYRTEDEIKESKGNFCPCCRRHNEDVAPAAVEEA